MLQDKPLHRHKLRNADVVLMLPYDFIKSAPVAELNSNISSLEHVIIVIAVSNGQSLQLKIIHRHLSQVTFLRACQS